MELKSFWAPIPKLCYISTGSEPVFGCGSLGRCGVVDAHEDVDGMSGKPSSTIAFEKRWKPLLSKSRAEFVDALSEVAPKPAAMEQILRINQGRESGAP